LIDGMELMAGINTNVADSDGDGLSDSAELPQAGVSASDPCQGPAVVCSRPVDPVFQNGYE